MFLEGYKFDIIHRPGTQNGNADAISRIPYTDDQPAPLHLNGLHTDCANDHEEVSDTELELDQTSIQSRVSVVNESRESESEPHDIMLSRINFENFDNSERNKENLSTITEVNLDYGNPVSINLVDKIEQTLDEDMASLQRACPDLNFLIDYLETRVMPDDDKKQKMCIRAEEQFVSKDGLLYRFYQPQYKERPTSPAIISFNWLSLNLE